MTKELTEDRDGFHFVWKNSKQKGRIDVDVYKDDVCFMEWTYDKVFGNSLMGNMSFWA